MILCLPLLPSCCCWLHPSTSPSPAISFIFSSAFQSQQVHQPPHHHHHHQVSGLHEGFILLVLRADTCQIQNLCIQTQTLYDKTELLHIICYNNLLFLLIEMAESSKFSFSLFFFMFCCCLLRWAWTEPMFWQRSCDFMQLSTASPVSWFLSRQTFSTLLWLRKA